jgi:uncharacterized membrane protein
MFIGSLLLSLLFVGVYVLAFYVNISLIHALELVLYCSGISMFNTRDIWKVSSVYFRPLM